MATEIFAGETAMGQSFDPNDVLRITIASQCAEMAALCYKCDAPLSDLPALVEQIRDNSYLLGIDRTGIENKSRS